MNAWKKAKAPAKKAPNASKTGLLYKTIIIFIGGLFK